MAPKRAAKGAVKSKRASKKRKPSVDSDDEEVVISLSEFNCTYMHVRVKSRRSALSLKSWNATKVAACMNGVGMERTCSIQEQVKL